MNEIEKFRDEAGSNFANKELQETYGMLGNYYSFRTSFCLGFDEAIALELPVKFAEWEKQLSPSLSEEDYKICVTYREIKSKYQYWIEKIYNPQPPLTIEDKK